MGDTRQAKAWSKTQEGCPSSGRESCTGTLTSFLSTPIIYSSFRRTTLSPGEVKIGSQIWFSSVGVHSSFLPLQGRAARVPGAQADSTRRSSGSHSAIRARRDRSVQSFYMFWFVLTVCSFRTKCRSSEGRQATEGRERAIAPGERRPQG